jgi:LCP family protein required for cell wall assembly
METDRASLARLVTAIISIIAVALITLFALQQAFSAAEEEPLQTSIVQAADVEPTETVVPTDTIEPTDTSTLPPTNTPNKIVTNTPVHNSSSESASRPSPTIRPTRTPVPSITPTSLPQLIPLYPTFVISGETKSPAPTAVPTFDVPSSTTNVVLIGTDAGGHNMDSIIVVGINRDTKTASMLSIPRDTYVYITPAQRMGRINTAGSPEQLKQTILYNFGIPIHFYAKVDFSGFKQAVDLVGPLEVAVSCGLRDWRLISPELDPTVEDNWQMFTLDPGIHQMDGDFALWFARSRKTTSDFDRGLRQQQLLRSMLNQGVDLNLLAQAPELWAAYHEFIETDIDVGRFLQFVSIAPSIRESGVQHLYIARFLQPWSVPVTEGVSPDVQLPKFDEMKETLRHLFLPPALNRATRPPITVEIINGTDNPDLARLASENFAWYGFEPTISSESIESQSSTKVQYFGPNLKGSLSWLFGWIVSQNSSSFEVVSDVPHPFEYRIILGNDYDPCLKPLFYDTFLK